MLIYSLDFWLMEEKEVVILYSFTHQNGKTKQNQELFLVPDVSNLGAVLQVPAVGHFILPADVSLVLP